MSETPAGLRRKIAGAGDLQSVVRTMKSLAASSIGQYERSVRALGDYYRVVELGLSVAFRESGSPSARAVGKRRTDVPPVGAVVFGSDQGLVGRFNEAVADFAIKSLSARPGRPHVWAVGERVYALLADAGFPPAGLFSVPQSVKAVTPLIGEILAKSEMHRDGNDGGELHLFYNRPSSGAVYDQVKQRLLPLDQAWRDELAALRWPSRNLPEVVGVKSSTLRALIREHLFISLFRACAESLASENASRLAAMQRAEKNIDELLEDLTRGYHRLRQSSIDAELFDVISGYELLAKPIKPRRNGS